MATKEEVDQFLKDFFVKYKIFDILFRDSRPKNADTLLALDITPIKRREIIENLKTADFSEGPLSDTLYGIASMWVFGKKIKGAEIYIKISIGALNSSVLCISFHTSESPMNYPYKKVK